MPEPRRIRITRNALDEAMAPGQSLEEILEILKAAVICAIAGRRNRVNRQDVKLARRYCGY